jgi:hypothetical protein
MNIVPGFIALADRFRQNPGAIISGRDGGDK